MTSKYHVLFIAILFLIMGLSCKKDEDKVEPRNTLTVSTDKVFLDENDEAEIYLFSKLKIDWKVKQKPDWIILNQDSGKFVTDSIELSISTNLTNLDPGSHFGKIEFESEGSGYAVVYIRLSVGEHPRLLLNTNQMYFSETDTTLTFFVTNSGTGHLSYSIISEQEWMAFTPFEGSLPEGDSAEIKVTVNRFEVSGIYNYGLITVSSNAENGDSTINVSADSPYFSHLISPDSLIVIDYLDAKYTLTIKNIGLTNTFAQFAGDENLLSVSSYSTHVLDGDSATIEIYPIRANLSGTGNYETNLHLSDDGGRDLIIPVIIKHYKEEKWLITEEVVKAEYDRSHDVLYALTKNPSGLRKFYPETQSSIFVPLGSVPKSLNITTDGTRAAIGSGKTVYIIDLESMVVSETHQISKDANEIILAPNNWVYTFPWSGTWVNLSCLNLNTGEEIITEDFDFSSAIIPRMHPDGERIYGLKSTITPADLELYDFNSGVLTVRYDSPYHGEYLMYDNMWLPDNGGRIYVDTRYVFRTSTNKPDDLRIYNILEGVGYLYNLDAHSGNNRIYSVLTKDDHPNSGPSNIISVYNHNSFAKIEEIEIPGHLFTVGQETFISNNMGYFGFFNGDGDKYYSVGRSTSGTGIIQWSISTIDV